MDDQAMDVKQRERQGSLAVNVGLAANIILAALKISVGIVGHSAALLADGVNSTSDVAYYIVVAVFMRLSRKPADREHPFGHSQLESIAALTVGSFVITTAIAIFWDAVNSVYNLMIGITAGRTASQLALWVALGTVIFKIALTWFTQRVGQRTTNAAIIALAYDHRNDVFSASAATIGIFMSRMGYAWVDPLAGALVALVILRTGIGILSESASELMDTLPGNALEKQIRETLASVSGVQQVEAVHAHRFGPYLALNITIGVDGTITVAQGDQIASRVERVLYQSIEFLRFVHVHFHPAKQVVQTQIPAGEPSPAKEKILETDR